MKRILFLLFLVLLSCEKIESASVEQTNKEVQTQIQDYIQDVNQQDPAKIASRWIDDGVLKIGDKTLTGKAQIEAYFKELLQKKPQGKVEVVIDSIDVEESGKAYVDGKALVTLSSEEKLKSNLEADLVNSKGVWLIQQLEVKVIPPAPTHFEELKELSWLIGNWQDDDSDIDSTATIQWDYNKNFILDKFTFSSSDEEALDGLQIIGWDPSRKKIVSWIYDSDGGFGHAFWTRNDKTWNASTVYTLPDGRKSSSIHTYQYVDDNTYMFTSDTREIDGEFLPNIGPFKVVRKKP